MPKSKVHAGGYTFCGVYLQFAVFLKVSFVVLNASVFKTYVSTEQVKCLMINSIIFFCWCCSKIQPDFGYSVLIVLICVF